MDWGRLARPLALPSIEESAPCPRSSGRQVSVAFGPLLGPGPVFPGGLGTDGRLEVVKRSEWYLGKVLWVAAGAYDGPILVRGRELGGPGVVNFSIGESPPVDQLRLVESSAGSDVPPSETWRQWPSYSLVPHPGCYAYQVDTVESAWVITFEAVEVP